MKKILLPGMTLAVFCMFMTNCNKEKDLYDPDYKKKEIVNEYKAKFTDYVGGTISPLQDWGFGTSQQKRSLGITRGQNTGFFLSDNIFKEYTQRYYDAILEQLPDSQQVASGITQNYEFQQRGPFRFDLIFACTRQDSIEIGYYYYDPKEQTADERTEVVLIGNLGEVWSDSAYYQYSRFSDPMDDQWQTPKLTNGYKIWTTGKAQWVRARTFTIEEGNVPVGCYVGFYIRNFAKDNGRKYYTNKYLNDAEGPFFAALHETDGILGNSYIVGMEDLALGDTISDSNDLVIAVHRNIEITPDTWPLLVIPDEPTPKPVGDYTRIIAEDLNTYSGNSDFDFNDIVLDVRLTATGADCILQAAGATLPIRINGIDSLEVHKLFGVDQHVMVNTNAEKKSLNGVTRDSVTFSIIGNFQNANDILIEVNRGTASDPIWIPLFANRAEPACKIAVDTSFKWPDERVSIKDVYPLFPDWVADPSVKWY